MPETFRFRNSNTGCFIGILLMVWYIPIKLGSISPYAGNYSNLPRWFVFLSSWPFLFGLLSIWIVFTNRAGFVGSVLVSVDRHDVLLDIFLFYVVINVFIYIYICVCISHGVEAWGYQEVPQEFRNCQLGYDVLYSDSSQQKYFTNSTGWVGILDIGCMLWWPHQQGVGDEFLNLQYHTLGWALDDGRDGKKWQRPSKKRLEKKLERQNEQWPGPWLIAVGRWYVI